MSTLRPCIVITAALLLLCCVVYPGLVTAGAQLLFREQADGSLVREGGVVRGSSLIGQTFDDEAAHPGYFWGRPSAASNDGATGITYSSGSNYGPSSDALATEVRDRLAALRATGVTAAIPIDLVTKSASGLDPHISPAAAEVQVARVAAARQVSQDTVRQMVRDHTEGSTFGFLGEPRVNVLLLDLELDEKAPTP